MCKHHHGARCSVFINEVIAGNIYAINTNAVMEPGFCKQAKSGFVSEMQSVISSILGARDIVFDSSKLGPKTELLSCFTGSMVLAKDDTKPKFWHMVFCSRGNCKRRGGVKAG